MSDQDENFIEIDSMDSNAEAVEEFQNKNRGQQLPKYKSHKEVFAIKIQKVADITERGAESDGSRYLIPVEPGVEPVHVSREYLLKHKPEPGGYYVRYKDGYESFSPAEAFEEGHTLINSDAGKLVSAKLIIEVVAGVLPGTPMKEHTRRWGWTSEDQAALADACHELHFAAQEKYCRIAGESREYAASLEDPHRFNWVQRVWLWL